MGRGKHNFFWTRITGPPFSPGNFQNIKVEQLTEGTAFPLEGWVSGEWKREEDGLIFLSLKEGELFWEDWCLGTIEKGRLSSLLLF